MDAPPDKEDSVPFVRIAGYLESMQLNAPRVLEADLDRGFLLLTDLGDRPYLAALDDEPADADELYADAIDALLALQQRGRAYQSALPPYDEHLLRFELSLFHDWLCGTHLGIRFDDEEEGEWQKGCNLLVANALDQPQVFVHRDYHSRNLMVTQEQNPGILDFQDAVEGPVTYDLVSLLKDCYVRWPAERVRNWALGFYDSSGDDLRSGIERGQFLRHFELMGVQRHLKAAGIFARLNHRDGKTAYMKDIPRTLGYITDLGSQYPELGFLVDVIERRVLPGLEDKA
jgi:aminoglycoside/choline kinase family phosphotransferase